MRISQRLGAYLLAGVLALSLSGSVLAQRGGARAQTVPQVWLNRLSLTDEQKTKVKSATEAYQTELRNSASLTTPKEKRQANRKARQAYESAVTAALNAEQQQKLAAMKEEAKQYQGMGQAGNAMVGLNLTDEQKSKIKEIGAKYQPELQKLRAEQRTATDKKAVQAQVRGVNTKMMEEIKALLTPEQVKQLPRAGRRRQQQ